MCLTIFNKQWIVLPYILAKFSKDFIFCTEFSLMLCAVLYDLTQTLYMYTFSIGDYLELDITKKSLGYPITFSSSTSIIITSRANRMPSISEKRRLWFKRWSIVWILYIPTSFGQLSHTIWLNFPWSLYYFEKRCGILMCGVLLEWT
jgi:hypothetical protein